MGLRSFRGFMFSFFPSFPIPRSFFAVVFLGQKADALWYCREWPTIPQIYVNGEFVGGCDILLGSEYLLLFFFLMVYLFRKIVHQSGELETLLENNNIIEKAESVNAEGAPASSSSSSSSS